GVLNALYAMKGEWRSPADLAHQACQIEIDILGRPIGKQDQYIAAFGGLQDVHFLQDGSVSVHPVVCTSETRRHLVDSLLLFYTRMHRDAGAVLSEARQRLESRDDSRRLVGKLVGVSGCVRKALIEGNVDQIGSLLDQSWQFKRQMASNVSNSHLDNLYDEA